MITREAYIEKIAKDAREIHDNVPDESSYKQENHIEPLHTKAAWNVAALLRHALEEMIALELDLNLIWDSWLEYHRAKYGSITAELLMQLHDADYARGIIALDPRELELDADPLGHYFMYVMTMYTYTKATSHNIQSGEASLLYQYLINVQEALALEWFIDMPTDAILAYAELFSISHDFDDLMLVDENEQ